MINEEFKERLLKEIILCKELKELTIEIKDLFFELINSEIEKRDMKRFKLNEEEKIIFENNAYIACNNNALKFNSNKTNNAYAYVVTIIRCSFSDTIVKRRKGLEI